MATKVESLLGFDGVGDKVSLEYSSSSATGNTVYSGTSFLTEWLNAKGGNWQNGWSVDEHEQSLLDFVGRLSAADKAEPTAVVWLHSEYDSGNAGLTPAEFASAVRFDAALVRQAFGQAATSLPYLFVSAIPYSEGTDEGHQAIRTAMEQLAADPAFNGRIAARALDTDMNFQDVTGDGKNDYGGPHQSNEDGQQTADRIALSLAQTWAQYAKPGSPVALRAGQIDDLGPQVLSAAPVGISQIAVKVGFDSAQKLAALDATAAAGTGWTVLGSNGAKLDATAASLTGADTLLLTFGAAVPAGGTLHYGHGYGRLEAADGSGRGHAVYDNEGLPVWTAAQGVAVGGAAVAPAAALVSPAAPAATGHPPALFGSAATGWDHAAQVWTGTQDFGGASYQTFGSTAPWGSLGGVHLAPASWNPGWSTHLAFDNLPNAAIDLHAAGSLPLDVLLVSTRGGAVTLGAGSDTLTWVAQSDAPGAGNTLVVQAGAGNDVIHATAAGLSGLDRSDIANGGGYDGHDPLAQVHLGAGTATVTAEER
ncbi:hypothetical protein ACFQY5_32040 [Paeniroseomonas aquatica]|uniref:hypothetical protein n=1 Tax=Paeniroseomonas aquatica TaxID=373043 RepID=UPI0036105C07